ncbi:hypothetical protein F2Q68_00044481 [Brassica cretica]|uniref:H15 domain-containing protein n=1 Tax=Brassica cretica TaxID=69181 RepID=A0A8S9LTF1_BRACR|nr:hypothetical protein F2Q68_00044481 [Brassica cretica]
MDRAANSSSDDDDSSSENRHVDDPVREAAASDHPSSSSSGEARDDDTVIITIRTLNDGNGADIDEIYEYIQDNYPVAQCDRHLLEVELNERVHHNELEMVDGIRFKIVHVTSENTHETTETESEEPVAVPADPPNTSSDLPSSSSSGERERKRFDGKVLKAIRTLNHGNGADIDEICDYLLGSYNLGPELRKLVEEYLGLGVSDNQLEMIENRYKIVHVTSENTRETRETESKSVSDSDDQKVPATSSSDYALPYGDMPEAMVTEAISTMDYGIGVNIDEIYEYIENRYKIPTDYMKILEDELNKRVSENEIEKGEYGYKILDVTSDNMDEAQSQAVAVADQNDPAKSSSSSDATTSSGNTPYYDPVIDAISTINDGNGVDIEGIYQFIQERFKRNVVRPNHRQLLEEGLQKRVSQCILEKVETHYKILDITPEKLDEINEAAAKAVAVSDQKDLEAKEAYEAADRAKKVLEENELVLQAAKEALDRFLENVAVGWVALYERITFKEISSACGILKTQRFYKRKFSVPLTFDSKHEISLALHQCCCITFSSEVFDISISTRFCRMRSLSESDYNSFYCSRCSQRSEEKKLRKLTLRFPAKSSRIQRE